MATLQSPGVSVTVIDESFYTPAEPGTTPLIVVATAQDKLNAAGTAIASATTKANAGKAYKLVSQKDVLDLFGVPFFEKTATANPVHGGERNEYGLLAAYSLLGVSNAAFIVRADVNLDELEGQADVPGSNPANGAWWADTQATSWGIFEWNGAAASTTGGQKFAVKVPLVLTDSDTAKIEGNAPKASVGSIGDYAVVFQTAQGDGSYGAAEETIKYYYKSQGNGAVGDGAAVGVAAGEWVLVGSPEWKASWPTVAGTATSATPGSFYINGVSVTVSPGDTISDVVSTINGLKITGVGATEVNSRLYLYTDGTSTSSADGSDSTGADGAIFVDGGSVVGIPNKVYQGPALQQTPHTQVPEWKNNAAAPRPTGSVWVKTTEVNQGARWRIKKWSSATASWVPSEAPIYENTQSALYFLDRSGGGLKIPADTLFVQTNALEATGFDDTPSTATFRIWKRKGEPSTYTTITSEKFVSPSIIGGLGPKSFTIAESIKGSTALNSVTINVDTAATGGTAGVVEAERIAAAINSAGLVNIVASVTSENRLQISHKLGGDFRITDTSSVFANAFPVFNLNTQEGTANFYNLSAAAGLAGTEPLLTVTTPSADYLASNWQPFAVSNFRASPDAPLNEPRDGQLWYNPSFTEVDIMVHNGNTWVGYRNPASPYYSATRTKVGPTIAATNPYTSATRAGDLWISTADLENFPTIYRYSPDQFDPAVDPSTMWVLVDTTDQTTEEGILFADARWANSGSSKLPSSIEDLLVSNYLDTDAPDPALYPRGMLLWNLRRSSGNVKRYVNNYIDTSSDNARYKSSEADLGLAWVSGESMSDYWTDRWVTASANNEDGSGTFGRHAQRSVVVAALKSVVDTSEEIRDEERRNFNLIACPGYPELMNNLVNLNIDRGITSFVIGDTPLRLKSDATSLTTWGTNANLVTDNGDDGIVTYDEYMAVFYPNGFTTDLGGSNAVVPASHMMLKTIALSDNVSYPWFAPAGTRRGGITNATSAGYIDSATGEWNVVALNNGQRDTLYDLKINPITFFNGVGLVNYGQKTRARNASALDRINVARLVVYLRSQLNKLARPFIFEPNDKITRDEVKQAVESLLLELVGLRALYDFAVVCDETNNTPTRIDRNELWVDIAIEPVKAVEFIYIPLRVKNTGEI